MSTYEKVKEWRKINKEKVNAQARRYRKKHPDKVRAVKVKYRKYNLKELRKKDSARANEKRKNDPEGQKIRYLKWRNKKEDKLSIIAGSKRPSFCEICKLDIYRIVFDHCHISGKFRGWICDRCNKVLGLMKDNVVDIKALAIYLEKFYES